MYGLTEAFRSTYLDPAEVDRRPDSIGKAIPNAEILVVRPDGTRCDPGEEGELVHRGALVGAGLLERSGADRGALPARRPARPGLAYRRDWRSGPATPSWRDEEGFLYFVGRTRRDDQDVRLPGEPDRDRGGRLRHRPGPRRRGASVSTTRTLGQRIVLVVHPATAPSSTSPRSLGALRKQLAALHGARAQVEVRDGAAALAERQVRPQPASRAGGGAHEARRPRRRVRHDRRRARASAACR